MIFPMGEIPNKYGIFTTDKEFADHTIDNYVKSHNCKCSKRIKSANDSYAIMDDGTEYKWIKPNNMSRGFKCSIGVIDLATCNLEFIIKWIPYICLFAEPEKHYVLKDSNNTIDNNKPYDLHTLIDRLQKIETIFGNLEKIGFDDTEYGWQKIMYIEADKEEVSFGTYC